MTIPRHDIPARMRFRVLQRDEYTCQYCGAIGKDLEIDHIIPVTKGGKTEFNNLMTSCQKCNQGKYSSDAFKINNEALSLIFGDNSYGNNSYGNR